MILILYILLNNFLVTYQSHKRIDVSKEKKNNTIIQFNKLKQKDSSRIIIFQISFPTKSFAPWEQFIVVLKKKKNLTFSMQFDSLCEFFPTGHSTKRE